MAKKRKFSDRELFASLPDDIFEKKSTLHIKKSNKASKPTLSKEQKKFNTLVKKIETLEKQIENAKVLGVELSAVFNKNILPLQKELGQCYFDLAFALDACAQRHKLGKKQREILDEHIIDLCEQAFPLIEPNEEQKALYDKYSEVSYQESIDNEKEGLMDMFREYVEKEMGVDAGDMDFDISDTESTMEYARQLHEKMQQKQLEDQQQEQTKTKTKKQLKEEQQAQLQEELSKKSLRTIYISLAKMLHPDTETDPEKQKEKSELMKKVTVAYDEKDLATLLRLEMEWIHRTSEQLEILPDDKLKIYNQILTEQFMDLNDEFHFVKMNPAFMHVSEYLEMTSVGAHRALDSKKNDFKHDIELFKRDISFFRDPAIKKRQLVDYINEVEDEMYGADDIFSQLMDEIMRDELGKKRY